MDARFIRAAITFTAFLSLGANFGSAGIVAPASGARCKSDHFIVTAPTPAMAREVCQAAERYRHDLAIQWLGQPLPEWQGICPIQVRVGPRLGAGGATSFAFENGRPVDFRMTIQGSHARVLDSVLPHEITHTIMATHFGHPLPRWADEGAATSVEHISERSKQETLLIEFLTTDRGIAFNHMFAMKEYPRDILPLYSQGYSLARYLIAQGGKRRFVQYVGDGMQWNNWTAATEKHYGFRSLSELQVSWLGWVRHGSPQTVPGRTAMPTALVSTSASRGQIQGRPSGNPATAQQIGPTQGNNGQPADSSLSGLVPLPRTVYPHPQPNQLTSTGSQTPIPTATPTVAAAPAAHTGWYRRQANQAARQQPGPNTHRTTAAQPASYSRQASRQPAGMQQTARPQPPGHPSQIILR